jgi:hypothetical protein
MNLGLPAFACLITTSRVVTILKDSNYLVKDLLPEAQAKLRIITTKSQK